MKTKFFITFLMGVFFLGSSSLVRAQFTNGFQDPFNPNQTNSGTENQNLNAEPESSDANAVQNTSSYGSNSTNYYRCGSSHYHPRTYDDYDHCCPYHRNHTSNVPFDGGISLLLGAGAMYGFRKAYEKKKQQKLI